MITHSAITSISYDEKAKYPLLSVYSSRALLRLVNCDGAWVLEIVGVSSREAGGSRESSLLVMNL